MKKLLRDRGLVERGVLLETSVGGWVGVSKLFHHFSLRKFSLLLEYFLLSGKYSRLL